MKNFKKIFIIFPLLFTSACLLRPVLPTLTAPQFSIPEGKVALNEQVELISTNIDAPIYYTTDGTDPTTSSNLYSSKIVINKDTIIKAIAIKPGNHNSEIVSSSYTINRSPIGIFSWGHGTTQVGDKLYITTRTNPSTITVFNNPNDLTDYQTVELTGHQNADIAIYDSVHNKIYISTYDAEAYEAPHKTTIIQVDPNDISNWSVVYNSDVLYSDFSSPIVTDGTYIYGATAAWNYWSAFFKIRISDWTLITQTPWTNRWMAHSAQIMSYSGGKEMYITDAEWSNPSHFAKVNLNNMTYSDIELNTEVVTDDFACMHINDSGSTCYVASDDGAVYSRSVRQMGFEIDTASMTVTEFNTISPSYGLFIYNNDLYFLGTNGYIVKYPNLDLASPLIATTPFFIPNELFYTSTGKLFFTDWSIAASLIEVKFP